MTYLVFESDGNLFRSNMYTDSNMKYNEDDIVRILEFLIDNIFVKFVGNNYQQTVGIPMGSNCAPGYVPLIKLLAQDYSKQRFVLTLVTSSSNDKLYFRGGGDLILSVVVAIKSLKIMQRKC